MALQPGPRKRAAGFSPAITAAVCTVALAAVVMSVSMGRGRLAFYPRVDDVIYMARGAELVQAAREGWRARGPIHAIGAVVKNWAADPPHSPWASGAAALGLAVFGMREWGAYVPTALPVLAFLVAAAQIARRAGGRWGWRAHALVILAATAPFLSASIHNLKPDYCAGILAAIGMMIALRGPVLAAPARRLAWIGVWFGLALLAKPAMMLPTALLLLGTLSLCTLRDFAGRGGDRTRRAVGRAVRAWVIAVGTALLVAAPHYALAVGHAWRYTLVTLTGESAEAWTYRRGASESVLYYLTGPGGHLMLDGLRSLIPLGVLIGAYLGAAVALRRIRGRSRRVLYLGAMLAAVAMAWAGPTISPVKIAQFASAFSALLWLVGIWGAAAFCRLSRAMRWRGVNQVLACVLIVGVLGSRAAMFRWTMPLLPANPVAPARAAADSRDALVRGVYERIHDESARGARSIVIAGSPSDVGGPLLTLWSIRDGLPLRTVELHGSPLAAPGEAAFGPYDLALVSEPGALPTRPKLIVEGADEYYLARARADPALELVVRIPDPVSGRAIELYRRGGPSTSSPVLPPQP